MTDTFIEYKKGLRKTLPFIDYVNEDKTQYSYASNIIDARTNKPFIDKDYDFRIGDSGGFLMNIDFKFINVHIFSEVAIEYEENIKDPEVIAWVKSISVPKSENRGRYFYCPHPRGSKKYNDFWSRETYRRKHGMTAKCKLLKSGEIVDLHITGDHYNYLNYGRIMRTPTVDERDDLNAKGDYKVKQISAFPRFWDGDYWNFKIDFFISSNDFHLTKGKARGKGYSFKRGSQASNTLNLIPNVIVLFAAYDIDWLVDKKATTDMAKINLDWYENHTYWKRGYISEDYKRGIQLGFKGQKTGSAAFGFQGTLLSETLFNNPSAAIGKRAIEVDVEEAGACPNLMEFLGVTLSSTEVGAGSVGTLRVYGTAGLKEANWKPFATAFYNPKRFKMMPFENIWDINARHKTCGFFHPQVWNLEPFMDKDGNSLLQEAFEWDIKDKIAQKSEQELDEYLIYVGQRANMPEEAFRRSSDNLFASIELANHLAHVLSNPELAYYRDGMLIDTNDGLVFKTNTQLESEGYSKLVHQYIDDVPFDSRKDFYGCIREFYPPMMVNGKVPEDTYYIVHDSVAKDKKANSVINKNSLNSVHVLMFPGSKSTSKGDNIVATYTGRPEMVSDSNKIVAKLCRRYNAKVLTESDRGTIVADFRQWGLLHYLYRDPTAILSSKQLENIHVPYGVNIGSGELAMNGLIYLRDWLYRIRGYDDEENPIYTFHYIFDIATLRELVSFDIEGNFDRVSALRVGMILLKAIQVRLKDEVVRGHSSSRDIYGEIGLYGFGNN